jgi:hypothetical protein
VGSNPRPSEKPSASKKSDHRALAASSDRARGFCSLCRAGRVCGSPKPSRSSRTAGGIGGGRSVAKGFGSARPQGAGAGAGESESGAFFNRRGGAVGPGLRSAELGVTAAAGRDRGANRRADLEVAAQRGDAQKRGWLAAATAHADGAAGRRGGRLLWPAPSSLEDASAGRRHRALVPGRVRSAPLDRRSRCRCRHARRRDEPLPGPPRLEHLDIVLDTPSAVVSSEAGAGIDETQDVFA